MDEPFGFRPLYRQVYDFMVKRITEGTWKAGETLPSEQTLATDLGVSQGTVRKALDVMAAEKLVERRQGKGTYVAEHTEESALFRFFRMARPDGERVLPECVAEEVASGKATAVESNKLKIEPGAAVVRIKRTRLVDQEPTVFETIVISAAMFPDIETYAPLPNALYGLYQTAYGVNIVHTFEQLRADLARKEDAKRLQVPLGTPLLHIDRVAISLDGLSVEWRVSRCHTGKLVYAVTIS